jgi:ABC-2 type transport system permease protein
VNEASVVTQKVNLKYFHAPKSLVRRFVAKRTLKSAFILGFILAIYMIAKASGFLKAYPTEVSRQKLAESLGSNVGIEALLGVAHHLETVSGYVTWNFLCLIAAGGAIWAFLLATKTLRGEEDTGRWELLLSGQTTARQATTNAMLGLGSNLIIVYLLVLLSILSIGKMHGANFTTSSSLFFSLALVASTVEFLAVGALASQLMPVRSRAVGLSAAVFGVFYMIRLTADTTSASWLLNLSPLGWIEKLQPMYNSQPIWLLPIFGFALVLTLLTIFLAGRRDLNSSIFADKDIAKAHLLLLGSPFKAAIRLTKSSMIGWLSAIVLTSFFYGLLSKGAAQSLSQSSKIKHDLSRLTHGTQVHLITAFLGITFLLIMLVVMFYVVSAVNQLREDEAEGYLDNFLVGPVSRVRWLCGRIALIITFVISAGLLSGIATWLGVASQHGGIPFHTLILASINALSPSVLILGVGIFAFGIVPRITGALAYSAIGWSFLIVMLASGLNLNHWLLDSSILHQIAFAPAVNANWGTDAVIVVIGVVLTIIGVFRFNSRDLQGN